jgi:hypothetical protein
MTVMKMEKCLERCFLKKLSRFSLHFQIHERTQLILFLLLVGESCADYLFGHFTFSGFSNIPFF